MTYSNLSTPKIKDSRIYKYYFSNGSDSLFQSESSSNGYINSKLIKNSKGLNLIGKVASTDFGPSFNDSFQLILEKPLPIKLSNQCDVDKLLSSIDKENRIESAVSYFKSDKKKQDSAFKEFPPIKCSSVLSFSSPPASLPIQVIEKKSYSTKEDDSMPKIKTMILTPKKTINDFSNVYSKNAFMESRIGNSPKIIPSIPSFIGHIPFNSNNGMDKTQSSCFLSKKNEREHMSSTPKKKQRVFKAFNSSSSFKAKKIKKTKKSIVEFQKGVIGKDMDQRYNYLFNGFEDKYETNWYYDNENTFTFYLFYITFGKSNEEKIRFGDNPLDHYQNLVENMKSKGVTHAALRKLKQKVVQIETVITNMPVFKVPIIAGECILNLFKEKDKEESQVSRSPLEFETKLVEFKFKCSICSNAFTTAQGLGGHMSRKHKDQSENYKKKRETREKRAPMRMLNQKIKITLCDKYNIDYYDLISTKEGKKKLKKFFNERHQEYLSMRRAMKYDV